MTDVKIAILTPTLANRKELFTRMVGALLQQRAGLGLSDKVRFIWDTDEGEKTTGAKRNRLIEAADSIGCTHFAFFDDDDMPGEKYLANVFAAACSGMDTMELKGMYYEKGVPIKPFIHSIKYKEWYEDAQNFYRCPNHLNLMKMETVRGIKFPDQVFGEDGQWSMALQAAGVLKTEWPTWGEILYHYYK